MGQAAAYVYDVEGIGLVITNKVEPINGLVVFGYRLDKDTLMPTEGNVAVTRSTYLKVSSDRIFLRTENLGVNKQPFNIKYEIQDKHGNTLGYFYPDTKPLLDASEIPLRGLGFNLVTEEIFNQVANEFGSSSNALKALGNKGVILKDGKKYIVIRGLVRAIATPAEGARIVVVDPSNQ
ncbi:MAG: hypothetical protein NTY47_08935, partial [Candidatus Omnitrophica bacterium]|nr:hypothetical protein [Candidatus Omnitrophota bacterium]